MKYRILISAALQIFFGMLAIVSSVAMFFLISILFFGFDSPRWAGYLAYALGIIVAYFVMRYAKSAFGKYTVSSNLFVALFGGFIALLLPILYSVHFFNGETETIFDVLTIFRDIGLHFWLYLLVPTTIIVFVLNRKEVSN